MNDGSDCDMETCTSSTHEFRSNLYSEPAASLDDTMEFYEDEEEEEQESTTTNMTDNTSKLYSMIVMPESSRIENKRNITNKESWIFSNSREQRRRRRRRRQQYDKTPSDALHEVVHHLWRSSHVPSRSKLGN